MRRNRFKRIFLSASIPSDLNETEQEFYNSADITAIRDSVRALATIVIPSAHLVWGGHPSITPLIRRVVSRAEVDIKRHVTLYQSRYFEKQFPPDNFSFENIILTPRASTKTASINLMRRTMLGDNVFAAGIFIGGMHGVLKEFELFTKIHPSALVIPVASTGAAAKQIFKDLGTLGDNRLQTDYAYMSLFKDLLSAIIAR